MSIKEANQGGVRSLQEETIAYITLDNDSEDIRRGLVEVDGSLYGPGDTIVLKMAPHSSKTLSSVEIGSEHSMPGMSIVSVQPVAVYSGSIFSDESTDVLSGKRAVTAFSLEMLPPVAMLGTVYVLTRPQMDGVQDERLSAVKIVG
ncbi:hypothetical protein PoB_006028400 [Plakobranchus ocellatus]|uniref:IgGFc-binding protein N-terminal domain-containing protein n=1 Tax=Plakobranchus ocellatus TaxID=259542 RepID=A0AAV4CPI6_9GAST|nr:hypothetical protein PoB_006028400 [Plakobranchus ocellatus]